MKKTFTKKNLADVLNNKLGYSKEEAKGFTKFFFNSIINTVAKEKKLKITKLGTFLAIKKKARIGRNPKTKEQFIISARKTISFIPSKKILKDLNE